MARGEKLGGGAGTTFFRVNLKWQKKA